MKAQASKSYEKVPLISMLAPVVPVAIVIAFGLSQVCLAFFIGILYAILTTQYKKKFKGSFNIVTSAAYDGFQSTALTVVLMFGVGYPGCSCHTPGALRTNGIDHFQHYADSSVIGFILMFGVIGPFLTQYRGPLSPWGLGARYRQDHGGEYSVDSGAACCLWPLDYIVGVSDATSSPSRLDCWCCGHYSAKIPGRHVAVYLAHLSGDRHPRRHPSFRCSNKPRSF